jgi:hypothetical protein
MAWRTRQSAASVTHVMQTQKRAVLREFLGKFNHSFSEINKIIVLHTMHLPVGVERTFLVQILEVSVAQREVTMAASSKMSIST